MPQMNMMVSTTANFELATRYLHDWVMTVINQASRYGINVTNLDGWMANRYRLETNIASKDPIFVWLNGHGNENQLGGQDNEIILDLSNNDMLSGRVCYAFSCLTALELGPSSIAKGCLSYIGYSDEFVFLYDTRATPLTDDYAKWFMWAGNEIGLSLLRGETTGQAYANSQALFDAAIRYWSESNDPVAPQMLACLYQDKNFQELLGSATARINTEYYPPSAALAGVSPLIMLSLIMTGAYYLLKGVK